MFFGHPGGPGQRFGCSHYLPPTLSKTDVPTTRFWDTICRIFLLKCCDVDTLSVPRCPPGQRHICEILKYCRGLDKGGEAPSVLVSRYPMQGWVRRHGSMHSAAMFGWQPCSRLAFPQGTPCGSPSPPPLGGLRCLPGSHSQLQPRHHMKRVPRFRGCPFLPWGSPGLGSLGEVSKGYFLGTRMGILGRIFLCLKFKLRIFVILWFEIMGFFLG